MGLNCKKGQIFKSSLLLHMRKNSKCMVMMSMKNNVMVQKSNSVILSKMEKYLVLLNNQNIGLSSIEFHKFIHWIYYMFRWRLFCTSCRWYQIASTKYLLVKHFFIFALQFLNVFLENIPKYNELICENLEFLLSL